MSWYRDHVVPRLVGRGTESAAVQQIRKRVVGDVSGVVLEIGFGAGHNVSHYPVALARLLAVEPSAVSLRRATQTIAAASFPVDIIGADAQCLELPDSSVDAVVSSWNLCTIPDPVLAVQEIRRVLRPDGALHFVEHGLAPDEEVRRSQSRWTPLQKRLLGGCHLNRDIVDLLHRGGMTVHELTRYYGLMGPKPFAALYEGKARRTDTPRASLWTT